MNYPSQLALGVRLWLVAWLASDDTPRSERDRGQATTEYALVLLAAALVAVLVIGWATAGGGAEAIGNLFNAVIDAVIGNI